MSRILLCLVGLLLLGGPVSAEPERRPLLWVVEGDTPVYLFGTIHVPDPRVLDLPDVVDKAFAASNIFYAELDMAPGSMASVQHLLLLPDDQSLDEIVGQALFDRLTPFMVRAGLPALVLQRLKPWVVAVRLLAQALMPEEPEEEAEEGSEADAEEPPREAMDMTLYRNAVAAKKVTGGLETLEEQIHVFDALEAADQVEMIESFLVVLEDRGGEDEADEEASELVDGYEELVRLYLAGDVEGLGRAIHEMAEGDSEALRKFIHRMFDERNVRMAERILKYRESAGGKTLFVAVGAGHYAGKTGILALLREKGETVRRIEKIADLVPEAVEAR